jgi:hypothetical protein
MYVGSVPLRRRLRTLRQRSRACCACVKPARSLVLEQVKDGVRVRSRGFDEDGRLAVWLRPEGEIAYPAVRRLIADD